MKRKRTKPCIIHERENENDKAVILVNYQQHTHTTDNFFKAFPVNL